MKEVYKDIDIKFNNKEIRVEKYLDMIKKNYFQHLFLIVDEENSHIYTINNDGNKSGNLVNSVVKYDSDKNLICSKKINNGITCVLKLNVENGKEFLYVAGEENYQPLLMKIDLSGKII